MPRLHYHGVSAGNLQRTNTHAYGNSYCNSHSYSNCNGYRNPDRHTSSYRYRHGDPPCHSYCKSESNRHPLGYTHCFAFSYT